jgi:hypothetical protein
VLERLVGDSRTRLGAAAVFALCLLVYAATLYPTVPGGDAGELVVVAQHLAVAHPPGYPLWTMLAWLATLVPTGSIAWRVAWVSALPAAAASALLFWSVASYLRPMLAPWLASASAALAAGLFAFSPTVWLYAVGAEVFPLHAFVVALLFALALAWERSRDVRIALAIAFTSGLGLTNHLTLVFYVVPIAAWLLWTGRQQLVTTASLARLGIAALAGLSPYAYLWLAGLTENPYSWGDTATAGGLVDHLLRRDYGTFQLLPSGHAASASFGSKVLSYAAHFSAATFGAGIPLAIAAVAIARTRDGFVPLVAGCALLYLVVFHSLANVAVGDPLLLGVLARFWMQADVALSLLAGIGFGLVFARFGARSTWIAWAAAALLVVLRLGASGGERIGRGDRVVEDYGRAILEPLPPRTLLLTHGDLITNTVRYLQSAARVREDVVILDQELLTKRWYVRRMAALHPDVRFPGARYHPTEADGFSMKQLLDANRDLESIAVYPEWKSGDQSIDGHWRAWPEGLASRVRPAGAAVDPSRWALESAGAIAALEARGWPSIGRYEKGAWERVVLEDVWQARHRRGVLLLTEAIARGNDAGMLTIARGELEAASRMHPDPPPALFKNLGIVYSRLGPSQPWLKKEELEAWKRYLERSDSGDPDRATIEAQVRQLEAR